METVVLETFNLFTASFVSLKNVNLDLEIVALNTFTISLQAKMPISKNFKFYGTKQKNFKFYGTKQKNFKFNGTPSQWLFRHR